MLAYYNDCNRRLRELGFNGKLMRRDSIVKIWDSRNSWRVMEAMQEKVKILPYALRPCTACFKSLANESNSRLHPVRLKCKRCIETSYK